MAKPASERCYTVQHPDRPILNSGEGSHARVVDVRCLFHEPTARVGKSSVWVRKDDVAEVARRAREDVALALGEDWPAPMGPASGTAAIPKLVYYPGSRVWEITWAAETSGCLQSLKITVLYRELQRGRRRLMDITEFAAAKQKVREKLIAQAHAAGCRTDHLQEDTLVPVDD